MDLTLIENVKALLDSYQEYLDGFDGSAEAHQRMMDILAICGDDIEEACEKATPSIPVVKRIITKHKNVYFEFECPECGESIGWDYGAIDDWRKDEYCSKCGKNMDWKEVSY